MSESRPHIPMLRAAAPLGMTLADIACERLEHLIVTLAYAPGEAISESQVCARLGMGRTPVREALLRLRYSRLVDTSPGRGFIVTGLDFQETLETIEVCGLLERLMVRRAVTGRTSAEASRFAMMKQDFGSQAAAGDIDGYLHTQRAFNVLIGVASRQKVAVRVAAPLISLTRRLSVVYCAGDAHSMTELAPLHTSLAGALAAGDEGVALSVLDNLLAAWRAITETIAAEAATGSSFVPT